MDHGTENDAGTIAAKVKWWLQMSGCLLIGDHIVLASGRHAGRYVNCRQLAAFDEARHGIAGYVAASCSNLEFDTVVATGTFGAPFGRLVAEKISSGLGGKPIRFCEARKENEQRKQFCFSVGDAPEPGARVLIIEDVSTSMETVDALAVLVQRGGGAVVAVAEVWNRSGKTSTEHVPEIRALVSEQIESWEEDDCPLCDADKPINLLVGHGKEFLARKEAERSIVLALDTDDEKTAFEVLCSLCVAPGKRFPGVVKINSLWHASGPGIVGRLQQAGATSVCADLKLKDIPATMERCAVAARRAGATMLTVLAEAGVKGMRAAAEGFRSDTLRAVRIFGVTVLTSMDPEEVQKTYGNSKDAMVLRFAHHILEAGLDGIVCSPQEATMLRTHPEFSKLLLFTPGIRPDGSPKDDQARIATPGGAILNGCDLLVIGRPILNAENRLTAFRSIAHEMASARQKMQQGKLAQ